MRSVGVRGPGARSLGLMKFVAALRVWVKGRGLGKGSGLRSGLRVQR